MNRQKRSRRTVAIVAALGLLAQTSGAHAGSRARSNSDCTETARGERRGAAPATAKPAQTTPATAATAPIDGGWPRAYDLPSGGNILLYQPQVASWESQKNIVAFSAVSYRPKAGDKPSIGTIKVKALPTFRSKSDWSTSGT